MGRETAISTHSNTNVECQHMTIYCKYGCGILATYNNKKGEFTCNKYSSQCLAIKAKNAQAQRKNKQDNLIAWEQLNWEEIQKLYDLGESKTTLAKKYGIGFSVFKKAQDKNLFLAHRNTSECLKIAYKKNPRKHSEQTKDRISKSRIKYLEQNPDKVPYKLNHYSKGRSYAENYWKSILDAHKLVYKEQYQIYLYQLDFAFVDSKIDLEIDGEQHYLDERISLSDQRRNEYLENLGWKIIRIRWSEFQKNKDKEAFVHTIIEQLKSTCIPSGYEPVERLTGSHGGSTPLR